MRDLGVVDLDTHSIEVIKISSSCDLSIFPRKLILSAMRLLGPRLRNRRV
jgi:hypothetical protein